jgi:hypothetical protein
MAFYMIFSATSGLSSSSCVYTIMVLLQSSTPGHNLSSTFFRIRPIDMWKHSSKLGLVSKIHRRSSNSTYTYLD